MRWFCRPVLQINFGTTASARFPVVITKLLGWLLSIDLSGPSYTHGIRTLTWGRNATCADHFNSIEKSLKFHTDRKVVRHPDSFLLFYNDPHVAWWWTSPVRGVFRHCLFLWPGPFEFSTTELMRRPPCKESTGRSNLVLFQKSTGMYGDMRQAHKIICFQQGKGRASLCGDKGCGT